MNQYVDNIFQTPVIKFVLEPGAKQPEKMTAGAAGFDIHAYGDHRLHQGVVTPVRTGMRVEIPHGYELQIRSRSGLTKYGVIVASTGTVDSDYRGELYVLMTLVGDDAGEYQIHKGDRVAQAVLCKIPAPVWQQVDALSETVRGDSGYGSTGR